MSDESATGPPTQSDLVLNIRPIPSRSRRLPVMRWFQRRRANSRRQPLDPAQPQEPDMTVDGTLGHAFLDAVLTAAEAGDPEAMANLGVHLYQQGRLAEAIDWTERAWRAGNVTAAFNLGSFYIETGDTHRADLIWTKSAELGDPDAMMCVARLALQRGDRSAADRWLDRVLGQDQPYPITALGVAYRDCGDPVTALRIFERAIALGDAYAMEYAARIHQHNGNIIAATRLRARATDSHRYGLGAIEVEDDTGHGSLPQ
jgi:TPR repeat protein